MGVNKLAASIGCSVDEAQHLTDTYFGQFPEIKDYIERCRTYMKNNDGRIWTLFGDKAQGSSARWSTQALNYRIQGGASLLATSGFWNCVTAAKKFGMNIQTQGVNKLPSIQVIV